MFKLLRFLVFALGALASAATLLSFNKSSHWFVRVWDFPRVQLAAASGVSAALFRVLFFRGRREDWAFLAANLLCVLWHGLKIRPYTPFAKVQVRRALPEKERQSSFRLLICNVRMENRRFDLLLEVVRENDPDIVLLVETDAAWERGLGPLREAYPHRVEQIQDNWYGIVLFSRLPLVDPRVEFLVQDDIPSVRTGFDLPGGAHIFLHCLHPRPPEPIRDQDSTPRDAELVIVGRAIREAGDRPVVVAGDLNDVAWSPTSELFLRLGGLLDPRIGRGFYNSYNADEPLLRWPLDHVFHSRHFQVVNLQRLRNVGSDHFPMLVELKHVPDEAPGEAPPVPDQEDHEEADEKIAKQAEAAKTGDDRPSRE